MSWAITMHKSQGQTLHRVKIDLKSVFEHGQGRSAEFKTGTNTEISIQRM